MFPESGRHGFERNPPLPACASARATMLGTFRPNREGGAPGRRPPAARPRGLASCGCPDHGVLPLTDSRRNEAFTRASG